ncbi:MAG TPA: hypothetical protein VFV99_16065 [Kofleriaceae bacterium]|nr:hypothetical protein [Kofleriaceae bacterium]
MLIAILPLIVMTTGAFDAEIAHADAARTAERSPQVKLADLLGSADSIDSISGRGNTFRFVITRGDDHLELIATTNHRDVVSVVERERDFGGAGIIELANLSWLIDTMQATTAVTRLEVDDDGAVTMTTDEGMRYMAIPGRGSGGNAAVEGRWAGEWNRDEG